MTRLQPWELNRLVCCSRPDCNVDPGVEWDPPSDHELAVELIRHLYGLDGCSVGGPLHVELDDGNIDGPPWEPWEPFFTDPHLLPDDDGNDPDGAIRLAEIRRTANLICEVMNRLSAESRATAIEDAGRRGL